MRVVTSIAVICLSCFCPFSFADERNPDHIAEKFFASFIAGDSDKALGELLSVNPVLAERVQQLQLLKSQVRGAIEIYGPGAEVELIHKEELSGSLQRHVYLTRHRLHPLVWEMYFYKADGGWVLSQVLFADQFQFIGRKK